MIDPGLVGSTDTGRGTTRAEDAPGTSTQSHISPIILVYEDKTHPLHSAALNQIGDLNQNGDLSCSVVQTEMGGRVDEFKLQWREAGPPNHHDDNVDSDQ